MPKRYYGGLITAIPQLNGSGMQSVVTQQLITNTPTVATGGSSVITSGGYTVHTFTTSGTFTVVSCTTDVIVDYIIVAGGGGGGGTDSVGISASLSAGGGGGGGYLENFITDSGSFGTNYKGPVMRLRPGDSLTITIGAGGAGAVGVTTYPTNGGDTSIVSSRFTVTAIGGGYGGRASTGSVAGTRPQQWGNDGGSGGGGAFENSNAYQGGISKALYPPQGTTGGTATSGGSGTSAAGGGASKSNTINGQTYATGGAAAPNAGTGSGSSASANTGNGGTGGYNRNSNNGAQNGGAGGSGIVIIRYAA